MTAPYYPELLATPVPRYTSYPTAAEFHDGVGRFDLEAALSRVAADEPLSLYVHIPYCHEICWYCGCNTSAANKTQRLAAYLDTLHAEIQLVADRLGGRGRVQRIAFGGGSPNAISPAQFYDLLAALGTHFRTDDAVMSIELDPRSLTADWFDAVRTTGIGRASLGVQTLDPDVQARIGRVQPTGLIRTAVDALRDAGVRSLNFDLMYGLPGQGVDQLETTLQSVLEMRPERIALFGYAHVPHLIPRQRQIDGTALPDPEMRFRQAELGRSLLTGMGYREVGFDHFALPHDPLALAASADRLKRNFQGFTDDPTHILIGLGASAISEFPQLLAQNEKNAGRYRMKVSERMLPAERGITRSTNDIRRGHEIERLLCAGEANLMGLIDAELRARLQPFIDRGLAQLSGNDLHLAADAWPYARVIASLLDLYRQPSAHRFSSAI